MINLKDNNSLVKKIGFLFVVYIFEVTSKRFAHYVQYGVVGFSLTLFYLVLLMAVLYVMMYITRNIENFKED